MAPDIAVLNTSLGLGETAHFVTGEGELPKLQIASAAASGEIYLHGAQVTSWKPAGHSEVLFTSEHSKWEDGRAIRGGIPVCFPWFRGKADNPQAPAHGVARTRSWTPVEIVERGGTVIATFATESDASTLHWWPHPFRLALRVAMGAELALALTVTNTGDAPFTFEEALHTYHRVGDATQIDVAGLAGVAFLDNTDGNARKLQHGEARLTGPTDNAYLDTETRLVLHDPVLKRRLRIEKRNSRTTVVWNPWESGAKALADLGDEEWRTMACVEASNILSAAVTLAGGASHTMETIIAVME
jgi:glucose-6-phosphate 1-epimerase